MKLNKNRVLTESEEFIKKFPHSSKRPYRIYSTPDGQIISVETTNAEIIKHCKTLGLK